MKRRDFIKYTGGIGIIGFFPSLGIAKDFIGTNNDTRFIFIIQRGAADGLDTLCPYGDKEYYNLREELALQDDEIIKLDEYFALNSAMPNIAQLYKNKQAVFIHAIASPYRERSHFDAQNILELGAKKAYEFDAGWLNRLLSLLPNEAYNNALALSQTIPPALRGANKVSSFYPSNLKAPDEDFNLRINSLYENDPLLYGLWQQAVATNNIANGDNIEGAKEIGNITAKFLSKPDGARIAMLETNGWDTHTAQKSRLKTNFKNLDALINQIQIGMGNDWNNTIILIATEFGRTAAKNGTGGTDHGTASVAMLLGGKVKGGKIIADWPGLRQQDLYESRDLKPTTEMYGLFSGAIGESFGIDSQKIANKLFNSAKPSKIISNLII